MQRWFYIKDKQKVGPCSSAELRQLAEAGQIQPGDMLLRDGEQRWVAARSVKGLFPDLPPGTVPFARTGGRALWRRPAFWILLLILFPAFGSVWFYLEAENLRARLADQERQLAIPVVVAAAPPAHKSEYRTTQLEQKLREQDARLEELGGIISKQKQTIAQLEESLRKAATPSPAKLDKSPPLAPVAIKDLPPAGTGFETIDKHALAAPPEAEKSIPTLARYLTDAADDPLLKVRAIYRWITDRITYDLPALLTNRLPDCRPEAVLASRKTVCEGYSQLFEALCKEAGVPCAVIHGRAKTSFIVSPGNQIAHTWNAVKLQGSWKLLDSTWSAGSVINGSYTKLFNDFYFLTPPAEFVFTHLPTDKKWQLLDPPVSAAVFAARPVVPPELFRIGLTAADVQKRLEKKDFPGFVKTFLHTPLIRLRKGPLEYRLHKNGRYTFELTCPQATGMAFFLNHRFSATLARNGDTFTGAIEPKTGPVHVGVRTADSGGRFNFVLEYQVE